MPGRCFVAMAFDRKDTDIVYDRSIAPAVRKAGMTPVRIDRKEHNRNINEVIVDELKGADLVIADLTYARPSVYFEAGFAERVGPVIYTVRTDHFRPSPDDKDGNSRVHFDLSMRNIIGWSGETDRHFSGKLERRIRHVMKPVWLARSKDSERREQSALFASQPVATRMNMLIEVAQAHLRSIGYALRPNIPGAGHGYPGRPSSLMAVTGSAPLGKTVEYATIAVQSRITAQSIRHFFLVGTFSDDQAEARYRRLHAFTRRNTVVFGAESGIRMEAVRREFPKGHLGKANELLWDEPEYGLMDPNKRPSTRSFRIVLLDGLESPSDLKERLQGVLLSKKR